MTQNKNNRLLKYKGKVKKFQAGGVTFFEQPTQYRPENDFARKEAAQARATASENAKTSAKNAKKSGKTTDNYYDSKFINNGLKGFRTFANDVISKEVAAYDQQVSQNGSDWATTYEGKRAAARIERLTAELTAKNSNLQSAYDDVTGGLTPGDLGSKAFVNGAYVSRTEDGNLVHVTPEEYYKDPSKYETLTVEQALAAYKDIPEITADSFRSLGSVKSGETFFNTNIKQLANTIKATDSSGNKLPVETIQEGYTSLLKDGVMTDEIRESGAHEALSSMWTNILSDDSAKNALLRRVWSNGQYRNTINSSTNKNKTLNNVMYAEMYRLAMLNQHPGKAGAGSGGEDGTGGKNSKAGIQHEIYGVGRELNKGVTVTEFDTHLGDDTKEILSYYSASRVPQLAEKAKEVLHSAKDSDSKSATLEDMTEFGSWVDTNSIWSLTGKNAAALSGMTQREFNSRAVLSNPDGMLTLNIPSNTDGSPVPGYAKFMQEYQTKFANTPSGGKYNHTGNKEQANKVKRDKVLASMAKEHGNDEIGQVLQFLKQSSGEIPTTQKIFAEVMFYGDSDAMEEEYGKQEMLTVEDASDSEDWYELRNKQSTASNMLSGDDYLVMPVLMDVVTPGNAFGRGTLNPGQVSTMVKGINKANKLSLDSILSQLEM